MIDTMHYQAILITIGTLLNVVGILPYIKDVINKKTKPRVVSWFNWTILTAIAGAAAFADHKYPAGILSLVLAANTALIAVLGFRYGDRTFDRTDVFCQIGAGIGLLLWIIFNSHAIAIFASVCIDFIAAIPTIKHAWQKPQEETLATFALSTAGCALVLLAINDTSFTALAFPIYLFAANLLLTIILLFRKTKTKA